MNRVLKYFVVVFLSLFLITPVFGSGQYDNVTYYLLTDKTITIEWDACTGYNIKYDLYLKRFEWDEIVQKNMGIVETQKEITFPKSGLYIIEVRARAELTVSQIDSLNLMDKEGLIQKVSEWNLVEDVGDTSGLTADQIRIIIIDLGMASTWAISIDVNYSSVDGEPRAWWVYSYIGPPGTIIIGGEDPGPDGP